MLPFWMQTSVCTPRRFSYGSHLCGRWLDAYWVGDWRISNSVVEGACCLILYQLNAIIRGPQNQMDVLGKRQIYCPYREWNKGISDVQSVVWYLQRLRSLNVGHQSNDNATCLTSSLLSVNHLAWRSSTSDINMRNISTACLIVVKSLQRYAFSTDNKISYKFTTCLKVFNGEYVYLNQKLAIYCHI